MFPIANHTERNIYRASPKISPKISPAPLLAVSETKENKRNRELKELKEEIKGEVVAELTAKLAELLSEKMAPLEGDLRTQLTQLVDGVAAIQTKMESVESKSQVVQVQHERASTELDVTSNFVMYDKWGAQIALPNTDEEAKAPAEETLAINTIGKWGEVVAFEVPATLGAQLEADELDCETVTMQDAPAPCENKKQVVETSSPVSVINTFGKWGEVVTLDVPTSDAEDLASQNATHDSEDTAYCAGHTSPFFYNSYYMYI
jgi:hypothetical protein